MNKIKKLLIMLLVTVFSCSGLVACDKKESNETDSNYSQQEVIKLRFDEAYQMLKDSGKFVQTFLYLDSEGNSHDAREMTKIITNLEDNQTKIYLENYRQGEDMYLVYNQTKSGLTFNTYDVNSKTYTSLTSDLDEIASAGGFDLINASLNYLNGSYYIDFNFFFEYVTSDYNGYGVYSTKVEDGCEFLIYTLTTANMKYEYAVKIKDNKVLSFDEYEKSFVDGSYKSRVSIFSYEGEDLTIDIDVSQYELEE